MARTLQQLQKQYNSSDKNQKPVIMGPGPGGRGRNGHGRGGKPKNLRNTVKRILSYVGKYKFRLILVFFTMILSTITSLCAGYMIAPIINRITLVVNPDTNIKMSPIESLSNRLITSLAELPLLQELSKNRWAEVSIYVLAALIILGIIYLISVVCSYLSSRIMVSVSQNSVEKIRNDLFDKLQDLPVKYFDGNSTGEIMSRFTNDIDNIDIMLNNSLTSIVSGIITLIGTIIFMVTTNIWLTLITIAFVPIVIKGGGIIGKRSSKYYIGQQGALGAVNGYIEESVSGQKVIKVFNHEQTCTDEFKLLNEDLRDKQFSAQFWGGVMGPILGNISQVCYGITVGVGGILMGAMKGLIEIWILFLVITLVASTKIGVSAMECISKNFLLDMLYTNNALLQIIYSFI